MLRSLARSLADLITTQDAKTGVEMTVLGLQKDAASYFVRLGLCILKVSRFLQGMISISLNHIVYPDSHHAIRKHLVRVCGSCKHHARGGDYPKDIRSSKGLLDAQRRMCSLQFACHHNQSQHIDNWVVSIIVRSFLSVQQCLCSARGLLQHHSSLLQLKLSHGTVGNRKRM